MALETHQTQTQVLDRAGLDTNHCAPTSMARALADDPSDVDEVGDWLTIVREEVREQGAWLSDEGAWRGPVAKGLDACGIEYEERRYLNQGKDDNPYLDVEAARTAYSAFGTAWPHSYGSGDRRYDCPTVAQWVRDHPDARALIVKRRHVGFVDAGDVYDLSARDRVDYALILTDGGS